MAEQVNLVTYPVKRLLKTPQGEFMVREAVRIKVTIGNSNELVEFLLYEHQPVLLLGIMVFCQFRLVVDYLMKVYQYDKRHKQLIELVSNFVGNVTCVVREGDKGDEFQSLIKKNSKVFIEKNPDVGKITPEKCNICLKNDIPITLRPYKCSEDDQANIDHQVEDMLRQGIIRPSVSNYSFPLVLVDKKGVDGKKVRLCVDFRKLNEVTESEHYPLPNLMDLPSKFLNAKLFSVMDVANAFFHVEVAEQNRHKLAFSTTNGKWEFCQMPLGARNSSIVFGRVIAGLIQKHRLQKFVTSYIDDIIVFSDSFDGHLVHV